MNGPITWALALICLVVVLVVREAYRDERLGAALLVGVGVATLLLLLVRVDGSNTISNPTAPAHAPAVSTNSGAATQGP